MELVVQRDPVHAARVLRHLAHRDDGLTQVVLVRPVLLAYLDKQLVRDRVDVDLEGLVPLGLHARVLRDPRLVDLLPLVEDLDEGTQLADVVGVLDQLTLHNSDC